MQNEKKRKHAYNPDEDYVEVEAKLRGNLESFLETTRSFNMIYTKEIRPWMHVMEVPQLLGLEMEKEAVGSPPLPPRPHPCKHLTAATHATRPQGRPSAFPFYVSTTMILTPGPVIVFLLANQNALEPRNIDWAKQLFTPIRIERWTVVNFSAHCDTSHLS
ncbi:hypothetical protein ACSBR1_008309 [Camellia fascicularis]